MKTLIVAIPLAEGKLTAHFGHCEKFALLTTDPAKKTILKREDITPPPHQPGLLPPWLAAQGVGLIIAGGMGVRARDLFQEQGVDVIVGAPSLEPEELIRCHFGGTLVTGTNACDH